jgi:hypothetical protein
MKGKSETTDRHRYAPGIEGHEDSHRGETERRRDSNAATKMDDDRRIVIRHGAAMRETGMRWKGTRGDGLSAC